MTQIEYKILVPKGKQRERLDIFLTHHVENATRSKIQQAIKQGYVLVDGKQIKPSYSVSPGELITISLPKSQPPKVNPENIQLNIVYEDQYLIVINKPAGMVTHPAFGNYSGTLVNALLFYCKENLSTLNNPTNNELKFIRPGIVHRLDKDTSGLMVVAKNDIVHARLASQFSSRKLDREYWAIVWGIFDTKDKQSGIIEAPLGRSKSDRKKVAVTKEGKMAITEYSVIETFPYLTLVRCKLKTGRTHQIRVHMHYIGHPVFGDPTYNGRRISWGSTDSKKKAEVQNLLDQINRQALHAKTIGFIHPITKQKLTFDSELPNDMTSVLKIIRNQVNNT